MVGAGALMGPGAGDGAGDSAAPSHAGRMFTSVNSTSGMAPQRPRESPSDELPTYRAVTPVKGGIEPSSSFSLKSLIPRGTGVRFCRGAARAREAGGLTHMPYTDASPVSAAGTVPVRKLLLRDLRSQRTVASIVRDGSRAEEARRAYKARSEANMPSCEGMVLLRLL